MKNLRETKEIFLNITPIIQTKRNKMDMMAMQNKLNFRNLVGFLVEKKDLNVLGMILTIDQ